VTKTSRRSRLAMLGTYYGRVHELNRKKRLSGLTLDEALEIDAAKLRIDQA
jgi:hypothetical protein